MDNPKVLDAVLTKGEIFMSTNVILGKPFQTAYWPIKAPNGKVSGMFFVGKPLEIIEAAKSKVNLAILGVTVTLAFIIIFSSLFIVRGITRPLRNMIHMIQDIAEGEGDLTKRLVVDSKDEIGEMAGYFNQFVVKIQDIISNIAGNVQTLTASATDLAAISKQLSSAAKDTADNSGSVAAAAEEMSSNFQSVSAAMEQSTSNVNTIASSTEEMTATVAEIAENAEKARRITDAAVKQSQATSIKMNDLGESAKRIGRVTEAITEISEQTNLLALNADSSKRPAPVKRAKDLRWLPMRLKNWPDRLLPPPSTLKTRSPKCRQPLRPQSTISKRYPRLSSRSTTSLIPSPHR